MKNDIQPLRWDILWGIYLADLCGSLCVMLMISAFPWLPTEISQFLCGEGTRTGRPALAVHCHGLGSCSCWKRTWICYLPKQERDTDPLNRTDWGSAGCSPRSQGLVEAAGPWELSDVVKGSFHGGVLPGALLGRWHWQLIVFYTAWQRELGLCVQGCTAPVSSQCNPSASSEVPYMCPWAGAAGEVHRYSPIFSEGLGFFQKVTFHWMGCGFVLHFHTPLPHCVLLITCWVIL